MRNPRKLMVTGGALILVLLFGVVTLAGDTKRWELDSFDEWSQGESTGLEISSTGGVMPLWEAEPTPVNADGVWALARGKGGEVLVGTGNSGKLFSLDHGKAKELSSGSYVAVTHIVSDSAGNVWFSTIPGGVIYKRSPSGETAKAVETGEDYVWDFLLDGSEIVAATGPKGKIVRASTDGKIKEVIETGEDHVMCLLRANGKTYAGTSGEGLVLELTGRKGYRVVRDFAEKEVRRLAWVDLPAGGVLVAAVNDEKGSGPSSGGAIRIWATKEKSDDDGDDEGKDDSDDKKDEPTVQIMVAPAPSGNGKVNGAVYALDEAGGARRILDLPHHAAIDLAAAGQDVYVAADQGGKVYRCRTDSSEYSIAFDLDSAQALALLADDQGLTYIGGGSPAVVAEVKRSLASKSTYTSAVLDAGFPSRWGEIDVDADGPVVVETRSGGIRDPQRGWSDWQVVGLGNPARIKSPEARYLQVRLIWPPGSKALLRGISIPYRPFNQSHYVEKIGVDSSDKDGADGNGKSSSNSDADGPGSHSSTRKLKWKVTNPDNDPLEYTLFFQPPKSDQWLPIESTEPITKTSFSWDTASIPDGWYRVKVVASDADANPPGEAARSEAVSERFLVDNNAPEVKGIMVLGGKVSGRAVDSMSAISGLQYSIDGGDWVTIVSEDGVLDTRTESFKFELPPDLKAGPHIVAVRAWDRALNLGSAQEQFKK